ncbi:MAG: EamA family transporter [bacterium]|jgi:drug/metabolite transporter (DMT)-like permease
MARKSPFIIPPVSIPLTGALALLGRTVGLGVERPSIKALGKGRDSIAATTVYFGLGELLLLPLVAWQWATPPGYAADIGAWILPALASGAIYAVAFNTYVWGMSIGEVSYLSPLYASMFVFLYAMDLLAGNAKFGLLPAAGVAAVALGVILLQIEPGRRVLEILNPLNVLRRPGAVGMLIYAFGLALGRIIDKSAADVAPPVLYAFVDNAPCVIAGIAILAFRGRAGLIARLARERFWIAAIGAFAGMYAYVLMLVALDFFPPSVVEPVTQMSVFIAIALGGIWFKEPVRARWLPAALVVAGAAILMASR